MFVTHNANIPVLGDAERVVGDEHGERRRCGGTAGGRLTVDEVKQEILTAPRRWRRRRSPRGARSTGRWFGEVKKL